MARAIVCCLLVALAGCTAGRLAVPTPVDAARPVKVELRETPFFAQDEYQCGPAALASVLSASSVEVTPEDLTPVVYLPGRRGSLQTELVAAVRSHGRLPYVLLPSLDALLAEVSAGRPVLVLQKLGAGPFPGWHYAVVIGYDLTTDEVFLRSGTRERHAMPAARFLATWNRGGRWALAVLRPGELPEMPELDRYMQAAAGLEAIGDLANATLAYQAATRQWPAASLPRVGLANLAYAQGHLLRAEAGYRAAIERSPGDAVARNNRAGVLLQLGCPSLARDEIEVARMLAAGGPFAATVESSSSRIAAALETGDADCPVSLDTGMRLSASLHDRRDD